MQNYILRLVYRFRVLRSDQCVAALLLSLSPRLVCIQPHVLVIVLHELALFFYIGAYSEAVLTMVYNAMLLKESHHRDLFGRNCLIDTMQ